MIFSRFRWSSPLIILTIVSTLTACDPKNNAHNSDGVANSSAPLSGKITIDGSDTVFPLSKTMAEAFHQVNPAVQLTVEFSGTGGGFKKFCSGQLDIAGASRPITALESAQCKEQKIEFIEVPVAFDSLSVVANANNTFLDCLTVKELKAIWEPSAEGKITKWNQVRASFPADPLTLFGPSQDNGTFDYFTFAIVGVESSSRTDYAKSTDYSIVAHGVAANPNALGYFGYAYYEANKDQLKLVPVDNGHGCVLPSKQTVADGTYQPLTRPLFLYVSKMAATRPEVSAFTHFYLAVDGTQNVKEVGYIPLPIQALITQSERLEKGITGSAMGNHGSVTGVGLTSFDEEGERERIKNLLVQ